MAGWVGAMQIGLSDEQREADLIGSAEATSKRASAEDLFQIGALSFLGEVLASMDRIARVTLGGGVR
jgi:DNA mismatch repair ATPase MutL